jgi:hypothetical protein
MELFRVVSEIDKGKFVNTYSYKELYKKFQNLKSERGKIIFVVGAPGTGKTANIITAIEELNLNIFRFNDKVPSNLMNSKEVFYQISNSFKYQLGATSTEEAFECISDCDAVMFGDNVQPTKFGNEKSIPFSYWTETAGFKAIYFYFLCIIEYLNNKKIYRKVNIIVQTAFEINFKGKTYYLFTDLGILSRVAVLLFKIFFDLIVISYSEKETIEIVKCHVEASDKDIKSLIKEYGRKPRFICQKLSK